MVSCPQCGKRYPRHGIATHIWRKHTSAGKKHKPTPKGTKPWNTGLTKDDHPSIKAYSEKNSVILKGRKGRKHTQSQKRVISESMKKAHKEGRAWNIGYNRSRQKQSYAEKFFETAIKSEFKDQNYVCEYQFFQYRFDFEWPDKKKEIEIDISKHYKDASIHRKDIRRDRTSKNHGWRVLRIKWSEMRKDPKKYIKIAKDFIDE